MATPEFSAKTRNDPVNALILPSVALLLTQFQVRTFEALTSGLGQVTLRPFKDDVYIASHADIAVFVRKEIDAQGEYLHILDLTQNRLRSTGGTGSLKDPRSNPLLNPRINSALDPRLHAVLNPNENDRINPKLNSALNPRQNSAINPRMNSDINPKANSDINPAVKLSLNPKHNAEINPAKNDLFEGPFGYDLNLNRTGFFVAADARVGLVFEMSLQFAGIAVRCENDCMALFDATNNWVGFLTPDGHGNALRFNTNNKWEGFVIW